VLVNTPLVNVGRLESEETITMTELEPFFVTSEEHQSLHVVGEVVSVLASVERTGSFEVFFQEGPEGAGPPPHTHAWDEAYYVIEGAIEVLTGDRTQNVAQSEFMFVPGGTPHSFRIKAARTRFLSFNSRAGASAFFRDIDRDAGDTFDLGKLIQIADRHAVHVVARPPAP
jgi:quercetin dioxygenase-like cupin family protein